MEGKWDELEGWLYSVSQKKIIRGYILLNEARKKKMKSKKRIKKLGDNTS